MNKSLNQNSETSSLHMIVLLPWLKFGVRTSDSKLEIDVKKLKVKK